MPSIAASQTLTASLTKQISEDLLARKLDVGELYMTEAELATHFSASRNSTREAVKQLGVLGILEARQRKGLLVGLTDPVDLLQRTLPFYAHTLDDFQRLADTREILEVGAAEYCALHRTEAQIERLVQLTEELREQLAEAWSPENKSQIADLDAAFHCQLLDMTGNPLVAGMHQVVITFFQSVSCLPAYPIDDNTLTEHFAIAEAVEARDPERVRTILLAHLRDYRDMSISTMTEKTTRD